jgi:hypothetical protein
MTTARARELAESLADDHGCPMATSVGAMKAINAALDAERQDARREALKEAALAVKRATIEYGYPMCDAAVAAVKRLTAADPVTSPGHTDLMVPPETIDAFMEKNPLPAPGADPTKALAENMVDLSLVPEGCAWMVYSLPDGNVMAVIGNDATHAHTTRSEAIADTIATAFNAACDIARKQSE